MDHINRRGSDMFSGMDKNECKKLIINSPEIAQMRCGSQKYDNEEQSPSILHSLPLVVFQT
ncbi:hypothetical protein [Flavobacterium sp.]|uniref:hypothetical protein n=1 Tax=Flavobacterium sp. TaxID=239 RepID=UPI003750BE8F